jgi:methylthioribose-1-phosphate isomerase
MIIHTVAQVRVIMRASMYWTRCNLPMLSVSVSYGTEFAVIPSAWDHGNGCCVEIVR